MTKKYCKKSHIHVTFTLNIKLQIGYNLKLRDKGYSVRSHVRGMVLLNTVNRRPAQENNQIFTRNNQILTRNRTKLNSVGSVGRFPVFL